MKTEAYANLPDILNADMLASTLGISRAGAYQLLNSAEFPTLQIGKRKLVPKDKLIQWIEQHTGGSSVTVKPGTAVEPRQMPWLR